jgi:hypothetical protein
MNADSSEGSDPSVGISFLPFCSMRCTGPPIPGNGPRWLAELVEAVGFLGRHWRALFVRVCGDEGVASRMMTIHPSRSPSATSSQGNLPRGITMFNSLVRLLSRRICGAGPHPCTTPRPMLGLRYRRALVLPSSLRLPRRSRARCRRISVQQKAALPERGEPPSVAVDRWCNYSGCSLSRLAMSSAVSAS